MKNTFLPLFLLLFSNVTIAQNTGSILSKETQPKTGVENHYIYQPPKGLLLGEKLQVIILFKKGGFYSRKTTPLVTDNGRYSFSFKAPDSTEVLIMGIADEKRTVIDNNNGAGYVSYLYNVKGNKFKTAGLTSANLLSGFARYYLQLSLSNSDIIKKFEDEYKQNASLKKEDSYLNYLMLLYAQKKDSVKPQLLAYAKQMELSKNDEKKWIQVKDIYRTLKMPEAGNKIGNKILSRYPNGELAKRNFWDQYYAQEDRDENSVLASLKTYFNKFKDSSENIKTQFYSDIVSYAIKKQDLTLADKYEALVPNKIILAGLYNNHAWNLCGDNINEPGSNLDFAKTLSHRSIKFIESTINSPSPDSDVEELFLSWDMFADTYALILYKQKQFDSAFYYQDKILQRGRMNVDGKERYAVFAEAAKGANFVKQYIERELFSGVSSQVLMTHLQSIYKKLNLPDGDFSKLKEKSDSISKANMTERIKTKFGTLQSIDFTLKNLNGDLVSLSSFKNKIVVLDFWATWCGPCRASFPGTQLTINQYKEDKDVVFLFIDTWENKDFKPMQKSAQEFITTNKYTFDVLLDDKDKVVADYKVDGIPTTFIINKNGDIVFMGHPSGNLALEIEAAKR